MPVTHWLKRLFAPKQRPSRIRRDSIQPLLECLEDRFAPSISAPVSIGTAGDKAASTSISFQPTAAVSVGNTILLSFAMDPTAGAVTATDTQGNAYTSDADIANGSGTDGVRTVVFSAPILNALTTSDTITVSFPNTTAKALSGFVVSGLLLSSPVDRTSTGTGNSDAPNSGTTAVTTQADELLFGSIGDEFKQAGGFFVAGTGFTALTSAHTGTSGTDFSHITVLPEFQIVSATGSFAATGSFGSHPAKWAAAIVTYKAGTDLARTRKAHGRSSDRATGA